MLEIKWPTPTKLVVIDVHNFTYARYLGHKLDIKAKSEKPLNFQEVEKFRIDPKSMLREEK